MKNFDIVIIGAGCSGLSLAYRLIDSSYKVCVIENTSRENRIRKTWSYWNTYSHPFRHLEMKPNRQLQIKNIENIILDCKDYNYCSIDSYDFDEHVFSKIDSSTNVEIIFKNSISDITELKDGFSLKTINDDEHLKAQYIFDSRPNRTHAHMKQVFKGIFVEFDEELNNFIPSLMDFSNKSEFHFMYSLPISKNQYLFESTYYTSSKIDEVKMTDEVHAYIKDKYDIQYSVIREEYGEIPLSTNVNLNDKHSKIINIGIPAGSTRASTGYTFLNIQKQSDEYIKMLNGEKFIEYPKTLKNKILRKMDNLLLMIIRDEPLKSMNILFTMFKKNTNNRTIRFLSDIPTMVDILCIIWSMPKLLFIKYAIKSITTRKV